MTNLNNFFHYNNLYFLAELMVVFLLLISLIVGMTLINFWTRSFFLSKNLVTNLQVKKVVCLFKTLIANLVKDWGVIRPSTLQHSLADKIDSTSLDKYLNTIKKLWPLIVFGLSVLPCVFFSNASFYHPVEGLSYRVSVVTSPSWPWGEEIYNGNLLIIISLMIFNCYLPVLSELFFKNILSKLSFDRILLLVVNGQISIMLTMASVILFYGKIDINSMLKEQLTVSRYSFWSWGILKLPVAFIIYWVSIYLLSARMPVKVSFLNKEGIIPLVTQGLSGGSRLLIQLSEQIKYISWYWLMVIIFLGGHSSGLPLDNIIDSSSSEMKILFYRGAVIFFKIFFLMLITKSVALCISPLSIKKIFKLNTHLLITFSFMNLILVAIYIILSSI